MKAKLPPVAGGLVRAWLPTDGIFWGLGIWDLECPSVLAEP